MPFDGVLLSGVFAFCGDFAGVPFGDLPGVTCAFDLDGVVCEADFTGVPSTSGFLGVLCLLTGGDVPTIAPTLAACISSIGLPSPPIESAFRNLFGGLGEVIVIAGEGTG